MISFGQEVELLRYEALVREGKVVGAGGIYRVEGDAPDTTWLGWLGVEPALQGQGTGSFLFDRLFAIAEHFKGRELKVYTPADLAEYARCRAIYQHLDLIRRPAEDFICMVEGQEVVEQLWVKSLPADRRSPFDSASLPPPINN